MSDFRDGGRLGRGRLYVRADRSEYLLPIVRCVRVMGRVAIGWLKNEPNRRWVREGGRGGRGQSKKEPKER